MSEVAPYISWGNNQSANAWIFDTTEFGEKFTAILTVAMESNSPSPSSADKPMDGIKDMSHQALYGSIVSYYGNDPKIKSERDYVKALARAALVRKSIFLRSKQD